MRITRRTDLEQARVVKRDDKERKRETIAIFYFAEPSNGCGPGTAENKLITGEHKNARTWKFQFIPTDRRRKKMQKEKKFQHAKTCTHTHKHTHAHT